MQPHHTVASDHCTQHYGLPRWLRDKEFACNARDAEYVGSMSGWGRSLGGWNGNPVQYSWQEKSYGTETCWAIVYGVSKVRHNWAQPSRSLLCVAEWGVGTALLLASLTQVNMFQACMCTHVWICDPMDCSAPGSLVQGIFQARILKWVGCCSLLQAIFLTQGSNLYLLHLLTWQVVFTTVPPGRQHR